jgi:hypothetical protein
MIVRLTGGLGNTFFQYAFGRSMQLRGTEDLKFFWARSTWDYALEPYNVRVQLVNRPVHNSIYEEKTFAFDQGVYAAPPNSYFLGYWQTEKYFENIKDRIREELTLKKPISKDVQEMVEILRSAEGVTFIHVRRGDYLQSGTREFHGNLPVRYYDDAVKEISNRVKDPKFFVFSDDSVWCRAAFPYPVISGMGFDQHEELYLMSQCRHAISANSSYSWWASWLGDTQPNRVVVGPKDWFGNASLDSSDIMPERWIKV